MWRNPEIDCKNEENYNFKAFLYTVFIFFAHYAHVFNLSPQNSHLD